jgi:hypothetical protein
MKENENGWRYRLKEEKIGKEAVTREEKYNRSWIGRYYYYYYYYHNEQRFLPL